jgi:hypothetical protein
VADVVTSQLIENGPRRVVYKFTSVSDGTGESAVVKVNATSSGPLGVTVQGQTFYPTTHMKIVDMLYDVRTMSVRMQWEATTPIDIFIASGQGAGPFSLLDSRGGFGGIPNAAIGTTGVTGSIMFSTIGAALNASYSIIMTLIKGIPQT